jgi:Ca-activated chloride channel family protein
MKTKIWILVALTLGLLANMPNRKISGVVVDSSDGSPLPGVSVQIKGTAVGTSTNSQGKYTIDVPGESGVLVFSFIGYVPKEMKVGKIDSMTVKMQADVAMLDEVVVTAYSTIKKKNSTAAVTTIQGFGKTYETFVPNVEQLQGRMAGVVVSNGSKIKESKRSKNESYKIATIVDDNEEYSQLVENQFFEVKKDALTTFSIDVDRAGYSNVRRMLNAGVMPPKDAVRIEEMINYFDYDYPQPSAESKDPVTINTEYTDSPWNPSLKLMKIGIQAKKIEMEKLPASNLVFLIDVSGSMQDPNKLPLVKKGFNLLIDQLREQDKVSIVVYAGAAGLILPPTLGSEKAIIKNALDKLEAGGSTAGGEGIKLAYKLAEENLMKEGNNRVILASDGDFNVGVSSEEDLKKLIEQKREKGVFLSVLGFGMGNYKDNKMEVLADKGNGNYAYIDNLQEAQKVFVSEFGGTLFTVAKDVKLQLEFNPQFVFAYRLIGYENRVLKNEDFNNDKKDAGEMGSGHTVTAIYEIIPVGIKSQYLKSMDKLKYQKTNEKPMEMVGNSDEVLTVKLRYKTPQGNKSELMEKVVKNESKSFENASENFRFAASVAELGLILRDSEFKGNASYDHVMETAKKAKGLDNEGYRAEFIKLAKTAKLLDKSELADN